MFWVIIFVAFSTVSHVVFFSLHMSVFQERPKLPPTQAQATARNIPPEQYSYIASIRRLLRNRSFILLIITYVTAVSIQSTPCCCGVLEMGKCG
uniref:Feline leukemia virus subgroup C receptor-related protein 1-like n=1 Tax=Acanthochromis polyacanthus TaxID=80966 RepID=A0A3Q1GSY0_9TELE